jgi:hypothetical protein
MVKYQNQRLALSLHEKLKKRIWRSEVETAENSGKCYFSAPARRSYSTISSCPNWTATDSTVSPQLCVDIRAAMDELLDHSFISSSRIAIAFVSPRKTEITACRKSCTMYPWKCIWGRKATIMATVFVELVTALNSASSKYQH